MPGPSEDIGGTYPTAQAESQPIGQTLTAAPTTVRQIAPGVATDLGSPLAQYFRQLQEAQGRTGLDYLFGGRREERQALQGIQALAPIYGQIRADQTAALTAQQNILKYMGDTLKEYHALEPQIRDQVAPVFERILSRASEAGGLGIDTVSIQTALKNPDFAKTVDIFTGGNTAYDANDKALLGQLLQTAKTPEAKIAAYKAVETQVITKMDSQLRQNLPALVSHYRDQNPQETGPVTPANFIQWFGSKYPNLVQNNIVRKAFVDLTKDDKLMASAGFIPGASSEAAQTALAQELAKQSTAQGKATLAQTQAQTGETKARTEEILAGLPTKGIITVPGQGGSVIAIPGTPAAKAITGQPAPVAGGPQAGLQTAPGVAIVAQTPGAGLSPEAAKQIAGAEAQTQNAKALQGLLKHTEGTLDKYMGSWWTTAPAAEWFTRNFPGVRVPAEFSQMEQLESRIKNQTIVDVTGAAVRETEEPRILSMVPDRTRDKPEVYKQKLNDLIPYLQTIENRKKMLMGPDGRLMVTDKNDPRVIEAAQKYPLPAPRSTTSPRVQVLERKLLP